MKIYDCIQGEAEWYQARLGKVTASGLDNLISPTLKVRTGDMVESYLDKKITEVLLGHRLPSDNFFSRDTEQGQMLEYDARKLYAFQYKPKGTKLIDVGFVEHDDGRFGCSPDALIGDVSGLEIKCPRPETHVGYLRRNRLPPDYLLQVHGSMYATGRESWVFMSYAARLEPFVLTVHRDEKICATIAEALAGFYERFDAAMKQLREGA